MPNTDWRQAAQDVAAQSSESNKDSQAAAIMALPQVKMIEIKLAQGAKPGQGGLLLKEKITAEIAAIRGIPMGVDCQSQTGSRSSKMRRRCSTSSRECASSQVSPSA